MEVKEADKIVVAKPVPSRPTPYSNFRSFSELLAGAIDTSPTNTCIQNQVSPIRPKTVRFKSTVTNTFQVETSGPMVCGPSDNANKILSCGSKSTVLYKPLAKVVSRKTFSILANLGNFNLSHQQSIAHVEACAQPSNYYNYNPRTDLHQQVCSSPAGIEKNSEPPINRVVNTEDGQKCTPATENSDRASYDGYNWRKYGQKQVKGSEYPRSYYKCTHPNCPVKKMVERSLDGKIAEIVYKGEHDHSKPQPLKKNMPNPRCQGLAPNGNSERKLENQNEVGFHAHSDYSGKGVLNYDPVVTCTPENSSGIREDCVEADVNEPKYKKRRVESGEGISGEVAEEPRVMMPNPPTDSEIVGDGFRWRKYGQKVVKGNPYPRSYYRCTNLMCTVRKHVERAIDDPTSFVTTYEGKHNHDMPVKHQNITPSQSDSQAAISKTNNN